MSQISFRFSETGDRTLLNGGAPELVTGDHLVRIVDRLTSMHARPVFIRMDNGPRMACTAVADWCQFSPTGSVFI